MNPRPHKSQAIVTALLLGSFYLSGLSVANRTIAKSNATASKGDLPIDSRTILGVTLGRSTLATVQQKLGSAKMWREGDASTAEEAICYVTSEPHATVIVFASNSEMAGPPENQVTDIRMMGSESYPQRAKCAGISAENIRTPSGLGLGISRKTVRTILGAPSHGTLSKPIYTWNIIKPLPKSDKNYDYWASRKEECFDGKEPFVNVGSEIRVVFNDDVVVALSFERMESIC